MQPVWRNGLPVWCRLIAAGAHPGDTQAALWPTPDLAGRANIVLSKRELATAVWRDPALDPHAVEVAVTRLRRRMGSLGAAIAVVHRRGYALRT